MRHLLAAGGTKVTRAGRASWPRTYITVAGMFMWACAASTLR